MKKLFFSALVLALPNFSKPFDIYIDAYILFIDFALLKLGQPIA